MELEIFCENGELSVGFLGIQRVPEEHEWGSQAYRLSYRFTPAPAVGADTVRDEDWLARENRQGTGIYRAYSPFTGSASLYLPLRESDKLEIAFVGANDETVEATFTLEGAWDTPIQPNLDRCDDYY